MGENSKHHTAFWGPIHNLLTSVTNVFKKVEHADAPIVALATLSLILLSSLSGFFPDFFKSATTSQGQGQDIANNTKQIINIVIYISHGWCLLFSAWLLIEKIIGYFRDSYRVFYSTFQGSADNTFANNSGTTYTYRKATLEDNQLLAELGNEAWGTEYINEFDRRELYRAWMRTRCDIFSIIYNAENKDIIGYACVIPLIDKRHYSGNLRHSAIMEQDISVNKSNLVYWHALYIKPEYIEDTHAVYSGLRCVFDMAVKFAIRSNGILYAEAHTYHNGKLLRLLGFINRSKKSVDKSKIYELPFNSDIVRDTYTDGRKFLKRLRQRAEKTIQIISEISNTKA